MHDASSQSSPASALDTGRYYIDNDLIIVQRSAATLVYAHVLNARRRVASVCYASPTVAASRFIPSCSADCGRIDGWVESPRLSAAGGGATGVLPSLRRGGESMRFQPAKRAVFFVLGCVLLLTGSVALAGPKEEVAAATTKWAQTLAQNDPDKIVLLYARDGVLWGTLSPTVRSDRAALRDYFVTAFKLLPSLKVTFGEQLIRVYGNTAVNTGYYTFSYVKDGENKTLPARFSFTFVKDGENWMIVDHHSSAMPAPPK